MKLSETLDPFRRDLITKEKSANTADKYGRIILEFLRAIGDKNVSELSMEDFAGYKYSLVTEGPKGKGAGTEKKKASTIATIISALCTFAGFLKGKYHLKEIDLGEIKMMRPRRIEQVSPEPLEKWDVDALYGAAKGIEDKALVHLLFSSGMRIHEVLKLRRSDIFESVSKGEEGSMRSRWVRVVGKGNRVREIPLNTDLEQLLERYMRYLDDKWPDGWDRLFDRSYTTYWRRLAALGQQAGVKVSPHVFRHTFGAELIDQGENIRKVAELLGHASVNTTMRYTKVRDRAKVEAVQKLGINGSREKEQ